MRDDGWTVSYLQRLPRTVMSMSLRQPRVRLAVLALVVVATGAHLTVAVRAAGTAFYTYSGKIGGAVGGSALGEVWYPTDVAVGPLDRLYVADSGNNRVAIFEADGTPVATFGTS